MANIDFIIGNNLVSDETEIANGFNNYFATVGKSLTKNTNSDVNPLDYIQSNSKSIVIPDITVGDIITVLSSLNNSSAGYDDMPASIMKKCIDEYITPLTHLINYYIRQGIFPDELKLYQSLNPAMNNVLIIIDPYLFFHFSPKSMKRLLLIF